MRFAGQFSMQSPLEAISEYYKTFSTLDLNAIVLYFSEPCMSISLQGVFSAPNRTELAHAFEPACSSTIRTPRLSATGSGRFFRGRSSFWTKRTMRHLRPGNDTRLIRRSQRPSAIWPRVSSTGFFFPPHRTTATRTASRRCCPCWTISVSRRAFR